MEPPIALPLVHLVRMTDDTGLLQHARHDVPDRRHGYCLDDNARALALVARLASLSGKPDPNLIALASTYAAFVDHAWEASAGGTGRFRNFMSFGRQWLPDGGGDVADEEAHARAVWALAHVAVAPLPGLAGWAVERLAEVLRPPSLLLHHRSPRAWAVTLLAVEALRSGRPVQPSAAFAAVEDLANDTAVELANRLLARFRAASRADWPWFEDALAYDNARLCEGALAGAHHRADLREIGLASLDWLCRVQTGAGGVMRPYGTEGFGCAGKTMAAFDQQPLDAWATVDAATRAWRLTGNERWHGEARRAHGWFTGSNELGTVLGNREDGGCYDGLHPDRANRNRGAESTLAWLHADLTWSSAEGTTGR